MNNQSILICSHHHFKALPFPKLQRLNFENYIGINNQIYRLSDAARRSQRASFSFSKENSDSVFVIAIKTLYKHHFLVVTRDHPVSLSAYHHVWSHQSKLRVFWIIFIILNLILILLLYSFAGFYIDNYCFVLDT